jgi:nucleoside-diphosphate-sugar epimerase
LDKSRVHILEGSIQDPTFIDSALQAHSVTAVFLCITGSDELFTTFNILSSLHRSTTVKHLVYISAAGDYSLSDSTSNSLKELYSAHMAVKIIVEAKITHGLLPRDQDGGMSWTILAPTLFFGNDLESRQSMRQHGIFDAPLGSKGVSRVSEDDIALAAANALQDDGKQWGGKKVFIGSRQLYTNQDHAQLWGQALGKDIKAVVSDKAGLDEYERESRKTRGPAWGRDLTLMFEFFEKLPFGMTEEQYGEQVKLLGREAASYEEFVERTAKEWRQ